MGHREIQQKEIDETVCFNELTEIPQEISGTLHRVTFFDLDGRNPVSGIILGNAEIVTREGRRLLLDTPFLMRESYTSSDFIVPHGNVVDLDKLLKHLGKLRGPHLEVKVNFKLR